MPLSKTHLAQLRKDLAVHQARLDFLRQQIAIFSDEAAAHASILAIAQDSRVLAALQEISSDPGLAVRLAQDSGAFIRERGIALPAGADVTVKHEGDRTSISAAMRHGPWRYACVWDSREGFLLSQPDDAQRPSSAPADAERK